MEQECKMDGKSLNISSNNIECLRNIFPEVFIDGKINFDRLKLILGESIEDRDEYFNFTWYGKKQSIIFSRQPSTATLCPSITDSQNWDNTGNVYIEGDNLEVLKLLQRSYFGRIKVIYIDPPYNTGKDFVYPDNYQNSVDNYLKITKQIDSEGNFKTTNTESDGRFHTNWLNMIYPRIRLSRNLLTEDGVIFISINDSEFSHLKLICDEIFGECNFVADLVWTNKEGGGSSDSRLFRIKHEHILCYAKSIDNVSIKGLPISNADRYKGSDEFEATRGKYYLQKLGMGSIQYSASLDYPIEAPDGTIIMPADNNSGKKACWRWSKEKFETNQKLGFVIIKRDSSGIWTVYTKQYMNCDNDGNIIERTQRPMGIIDEFSSTQAAKYMESIGLGNCFNYTKPVDLIKYLIDRVSDSDDIIMDYFSGSATTAQAVLELNKNDGKNRRYILVQIPEKIENNPDFKTIPEIGRTRINKSIKADLSSFDNHFDSGYRVFKLKSSNILPWKVGTDLQQSVFDFGNNLIDGSRTDMDVVFELLLKLGLDLSSSITEVPFSDSSIYVISDGALMIYLGKIESLDLFNKMIQIYKETNPYVCKIVVLDNGFSNDDLKLNARETLKSAGFPSDSFMTL